MKTALPTDNTNIWWCCDSSHEKALRIDRLCELGWQRGRRVAVLTANEQIISNLTVMENIQLPRAWHLDACEPAADVLDCMQKGLQPGYSLPELLARQGALLSSHERRWLGVARAIHLQANWLVVEDDEKNPQPFTDERIIALSDRLAAITLHCVSLRAITPLPAGWQTGSSSGDLT